MSLLLDFEVLSLLFLALARGSKNAVAGETVNADSKMHLESKSSIEPRGTIRHGDGGGGSRGCERIRKPGTLRKDRNTRAMNV